MPKNKFQEVIFTIIMVFFMVYAMICYNIVLNTGAMTNQVFLSAFHELTFMGPIAFVLDFFIVSSCFCLRKPHGRFPQLPSIQHDPCDFRCFCCFYVSYDELFCNTFL